MITELEGSCGSCYRGFTKPDGRISCGCGFEDAQGVKPIWAVRKYSMAYILAKKDGKDVPGTDCEDMSPDDGEQCGKWLLKAGSI